MALARAFSPTGTVSDCGDGTEGLKSLSKNASATATGVRLREKHSASFSCSPKPEGRSGVLHERTQRFELALQDNLSVLVTQPLLDHRRVDAPEVGRHLQV